VLALSFLIVVGVALLADGFGVHVPRGYIYFAMAFSVIVEMLNLRMRKKTELKSPPVRLREQYTAQDEVPAGLQEGPGEAGQDHPGPHRPGEHTPDQGRI